MRREFVEDEGLFPNFAGFADLMSALSLLFIIVASVLLVQTRQQIAEISMLESKNETLINEKNKLEQVNADLVFENTNLLLKNEVLKKDNIQVPKKIIIPNELNGKVFFKSGKAVIQREFYRDLDSFANQIKSEFKDGNYNFVEIEGHTDSRSISTFKYDDNWDLGAARAVAVARYFISKGINPEQLSAVSHGEYKPAVVGENDFAYSKNRRIEITLLKKQ